MIPSIIGYPRRIALRDAYAYRDLIRLAGGDILPADFEDIKAFAKGLYGIAGRVDFLTLRSTQNTAGGVAYSFHGVAFTLTNGPVWSSEGVQFVIGGLTGSRIPLGSWLLPSHEGQWTYTAVLKDSGASVSPIPAGGDWTTKPQIRLRFSNNANSYIGYADQDGVNFGGNVPFPEGVSPTNWNMFSLSKLANGNGASFVNGSLLKINNNGQASASFDANPTNALGNSGFGAEATDAHAAFLVRLPIGSQTESPHQSIYSLYKSTIGKGLGLP